jgi:hypothetical protein
MSWIVPTRSWESLTRLSHCASSHCILSNPLLSTLSFSYLGSSLSKLIWRWILVMPWPWSWSRVSAHWTLPLKLAHRISYLWVFLIVFCFIKAGTGSLSFLFCYLQTFLALWHLGRGGSLLRETKWWVIATWTWIWISRFGIRLDSQRILERVRSAKDVSSAVVTRSRR